MAELSTAVDAIAAEAVSHRTTYRDHNLLYEVLDDPAFPSGTKPILFDPQAAVDHSGTFIKADWPHIQEIVLGN
jgi:hypothetical protein